jgi:hypothetical protein
MIRTRYPREPKAMQNIGMLFNSVTIALENGAQLLVDPEDDKLNEMLERACVPAEHSNNVDAFFEFEGIVSDPFFPVVDCEEDCV